MGFGWDTGDCREDSLNSKQHESPAQSERKLRDRGDIRMLEELQEESRLKFCSCEKDMRFEETESSGGS